MKMMGKCLLLRALPLTLNRHVETEEQMAVSSSTIVPNYGCIVACYGLKNAPHLNGKIGDIRSAPKQCGDSRFAVHFEDKTLKPALVKPQNLRIVFDLPDLDE